jgi:ribonuclease P protein component
MSAPSKAKTKHFVLQYLSAEPSSISRRKAVGSVVDLSTTEPQPKIRSVDGSIQSYSVSKPRETWLGVVVPKRYAKRAVTRSLIKRRMYFAVESQQRSESLQLGLWVLRLRAEYDRPFFTSATSASLRSAIDTELRLLFSLSGAKTVPQTAVRS